MRLWTFKGTSASPWTTYLRAPHRERVFAINDVTGAPGFLVEMANGGPVVESFHVQVRCAHVS
jgi:hypothetical protein